MRRMGILVGAALALVASVQHADAGKIDLRWFGDQSGYVTVAGVVPNRAVVAAGLEITVMDHDLGGNPPANVLPYTDGQKFYAMCVDMLRYAQDPTTDVEAGLMSNWSQTYTPPDATFPKLDNPNAGRAVAYLFNMATAGGTLASSAALQLAIWEILYEGDGVAPAPSYDVNSGSVVFTGFFPTTLTAANNLLATYVGLGQAVWLKGLPDDAGVGSTKQDFVAPVPVPEPASFAALALGLAAVAGAARRRKQ